MPRRLGDGRLLATTRRRRAATLRDGWLHTGDVGAMDADGFFTLKDRSKDMIISGGTNIYPREVEEVLLRQPAVREVSVIGRPDPDWGEEVVAYVVGGRSARRGTRRAVPRAIARFKRPKDYVFVDALPKNNYGKVLKTELRERDAPRQQIALKVEWLDIVDSPGYRNLAQPASEQPGRRLSQARREGCRRPPAPRQARHQATYGELLEKADPTIRDQIGPEVLEEKTAACTRNIARLDARQSRDAELDALIIIGDDQNEQYGDDNMPAILIYRGKTIINNPLHMGEDAPEFWRKARSQYHVKPTRRANIRSMPSWPAPHRQADRARLRHQPGQEAVQGARRGSRLRLRAPAHDEREVVPIVPVALNTYFPPNQPRPRRCYELGQAIRKAVRARGDERVGILGSGGLSHFTVDEELDRCVLDACKNNDGEALCLDPDATSSIPARRKSATGSPSPAPPRTSRMPGRNTSRAIGRRPAPAAAWASRSGNKTATNA